MHNCTLCIMSGFSSRARARASNHAGGRRVRFQAFSFSVSTAFNDRPARRRCDRPIHQKIKSCQAGARRKGHHNRRSAVVSSSTPQARVRLRNNRAATRPECRLVRRVSFHQLAYTMNDAKRRNASEPRAAARREAKERRVSSQLILYFITR